MPRGPTWDSGASSPVFNFKDEGVKHFLRQTDAFINKASFFCLGNLHMVLVSAVLLQSGDQIPEEPPIIRNHAIKMFNLGGKGIRD